MPTKNPYPPRPKKHLGQHFLADGNLLRKIVAISGAGKGDRVLEIGPGTGALTRRLLETGAIVLAVEIDRGLAERLGETFATAVEKGALEIICADILKVSLSTLARERDCRFNVVANLPYNISGPVLARLLAERRALTSMTLMFQREVAERITARPGTKAYGALSVMAQAYTDCKIEFDVSRRLFKPQPRVDSSIVSLKVLERPGVEVADETFFKRVVRSAFGTRRKTLVNALKPLSIDKDALARAIRSAGIDPSTRGETLGIAEFGALARELSGLTATP